MKIYTKTSAFFSQTGGGGAPDAPVLDVLDPPLDTKKIYVKTTNFVKFV